MVLVFWQNILSPHQAPLLRALADLGHDVTVVAAEAMTPDRVHLGWKTPELGRARIVIAPTSDEVSAVVESSHPESVHVMAGARLVELGKQAYKACLLLNRRMGVMSEAPDPRGLGVYGRWAKYTMERWLRGANYQFVLAMGEMGVRWFRSCGYPAKRLFPFAYVTEAPDQPATNGRAAKLTFLYVGRFIPLKGLDRLLRAFAAVNSENVMLRLLGGGTEQRALQRLADDLGVSKRLAWLPKADSAGVLSEMGKADATVLPSLKDGWGAVVNESLMAGTPVICSTVCGAADLIRQPWLGTVFPSGSVGALATALRHWINQGIRTSEDRERIRAWAQCISGESVAKYFLAIMDHVYSAAARPIAPWRIPEADLSSDLRRQTSVLSVRN